MFWRCGDCLEIMTLEQFFSSSNENFFSVKLFEILILLMKSWIVDVFQMRFMKSSSSTGKLENLNHNAYKRYFHQKAQGEPQQHCLMQQTPHLLNDSWSLKLLWRNIQKTFYRP